MESPKGSSSSKSFANVYQASNSVTESPVMAMLAEQRLPRPNKPIDRRVLSSGSLVAIAYMLCCGSPEGNEVLMTYGGPLAGFAGLFVFVIVYTIPFSYVVAELSTAFPDDGGVAIWVMNAFGPFWGFQTGFWTWTSLICACASAPDDLYHRLGETYGFPESSVLATCLKIGFALVLALPSFFGVRIVGRLSLIFMVIVLFPFAILTVIGYTNGSSWGDLFAIRREMNSTLSDTNVTFSGSAELGLSDILSDLFYGFDGIVLMSVFGGEVSNPAVAYSSAIFIKLALQVGSYFFPLSSAVVYGKPAWYNFGTGTFMEIGTSMGTLLENLLQLSSDCSNMAFFLAGMFSQAYLLYGMANTSMIPHQVAHRSAQFGTPNVAAFLGVVVVVLCVIFNPPFTSSIASAFSAMSQLVVILTAIQLRRVLPDATRPTKVPGNWLVLCLLMVVPVAILCYMIYTAFSCAKTTMITIALVALGLVLGVVFQRYDEEQQRHPQLYGTNVEETEEINYMEQTEVHYLKEEEEVLA